MPLLARSAGLSPELTCFLSDGELLDSMDSVSYEPIQKRRRFGQPMDDYFAVGPGITGVDGDGEQCCYVV